MNIEEVKSELIKAPGNYYVAVQFDLETKHFGVYYMSGEEDEPENIYLSYEGGGLFSSDGEEADYDIDNLPDELLKLNFRFIDEPIFGYHADYLAYKLFPSLPNPENLYTEQDRHDFSLRLANTINAL